MQFTEEDQKRYEIIAARTTVRGKASLADLTRYVKDERVMHCPGSGYLVQKDGVPSTKLYGACRALDQCLWSEKPVASSKSRKRPRSDALVFDNGRSYFGVACGQARGKDVHEECAHITMWDAKRFAARYKSVDPMTKAVLLHLKGLGYTRVHAEYMVYDKALGAGTAVDMVCLDRAGHIVFVELKTGYQDIFTRHRENMKAPLAAIKDSPLNRARTQLLFAIALYTCNHREVPLGRVVHVNRDNDVVSFTMGEVATDARARKQMRSVLQANRQRQANLRLTKKKVAAKKGRPVRKKKGARHLF